jgi:hypothetical protein
VSAPPTRPQRLDRQGLAWAKVRAHCVERGLPTPEQVACPLGEHPENMRRWGAGVSQRGGAATVCAGAFLAVSPTACVSLTVSPTVSPSPSLPLCLPHRLSHCVSLAVSTTVSLSPSLQRVSLTVSPTVSPSPSLPLHVSPSPSLPLCLPRRLYHCVSLTVSPTCLPHRLSHCVSLTVSPTVSPSPS